MTLLRKFYFVPIFKTKRWQVTHYSGFHNTLGSTIYGESVEYNLVPRYLKPRGPNFLYGQDGGLANYWSSRLYNHLLYPLFHFVLCFQLPSLSFTHAPIQRGIDGKPFQHFSHKPLTSQTTPFHFYWFGNLVYRIENILLFNGT